MNSVDFSLKLITSYSDSEYIWGLYTRTYENPEVLFDWIFFENAEENEKWRKLISKTMNKTENCAVIVEWAFNTELVYDHLIKFNKYKRLEMPSDLPQEEILKKKFKFTSEYSETEKEQLKGGWKIERQRTDKNHPNSLTVAKNIQATILDPVTVDDIINWTKKFNEKYSKPGIKRVAGEANSNGHKRAKIN